MIPNKKSQKKGDEKKIKLHEANQSWNAWKFKIHWNKLEWVNPRSRDKRKNHFVCLLKNNLKITLGPHIGLVTCNSYPYIQIIYSKGHQLFMTYRLV